METKFTKKDQELLEELGRPSEIAYELIKWAYDDPDSEILGEDWNRAAKDFLEKYEKGLGLN